jgi:hypothetical protein
MMNFVVLSLISLMGFPVARLDVLNQDIQLKQDSKLNAEALYRIRLELDMKLNPESVSYTRLKQGIRLTLHHR